MHGYLLGVREMLNCFSHVLVIPSAPSGTLTVLRLASPYVLYLIKYIVVWGASGEGDGRCVHASEPDSKELSNFFLLLNPPSGVIS